MTPVSDQAVSYFARTNFHNGNKPFGIKQPDRLSHVYVIGKTGVGKSTLLETLAREDLVQGRGFALIDPHGDLVERVFAAVPAEHRERVAYLNAPDPLQLYGYNPLRRVRSDKIPLAASGLLETLKKLWPDAWGVRMEHVLRNSLYALLERDDAKIPDILRLFSDEAYRKAVARDTQKARVRKLSLPHAC
jgi:DNA helicase HerA-like ATPase